MGRLLYQGHERGQKKIDRVRRFIAVFYEFGYRVATARRLIGCKGEVFPI